MSPKNSYFLPYQTAWIRDDSRLKILEKSRQIGMSLSTAYAAVRRHTSKTTQYDTWVASRDAYQSQLFLDDCKKFARLLAPACQYFGSVPVSDPKASSSISLKFSDGRAIHAVSSSINVQAGKRGTRILDEFALHENQKALYTTALPGITWGGQLIILSTHRGSQNYFNQLIREIVDNGNPKQFSYHRVTLQDALEQGFLEKLKARWAPSDDRQSMTEQDYFDAIKKSCPDEASFLQEYMCVPQDDRYCFLSNDDINGCEYSDHENWEQLNEHREYYVGVDIGRTHDLTVFWLLERYNGLLLTRKVEVLQNIPFAQQEQVLFQWLKLSTVRRICIDQTGIGRQFAERTSAAFGGYRVEGITFSSTIKEILAYQLKTAFENHQVKIPSDEFIRADLLSIRKETTFSGNIRFGGDRSSNGHADRFWALALAVYAAGDIQTGQPYIERIDKYQPRKFL